MSVQLLRVKNVTFKIFCLQLPFTSHLKGLWDLQGTFGSLFYFCAVLHHDAGLVSLTCMFSGFNATLLARPQGLNMTYSDRTAVAKSIKSYI